MAHFYRDIESSTAAHRRHAIKRPIVRWIAFGSVIVIGAWLLHPYFLEYWYQRDNRPAFLPDWPAATVVVEDKVGGNGTKTSPESVPSYLEDVPIDTGSSDWPKRKEQVKSAYKHALTGYMERAFPNDELAPLSGGFTNKYNGWGVSLFDSLDTMWIMGLYDEFNQALEHVAKETFTLPPLKYAPFFETTIRYLGGLLSAYALSGATILLSRADDLGQKLLPAFNGTTSGLPVYSVHPQTGEARFGWLGPSVLFAEAASCQLEFKYLAKMTGRAEYYEKVENVMSIIYKADVKDGLFPEYWDDAGQPSGAHLTAGAAVDSGYEYLLKQYLLMGDARARDQYIKSANGIIDNFLYVSPNRQLLYATDLRSNQPTHRYEHLTCFLPGLFALGAQTLDLSARDKQIHEWAAKGLAYTCYIAYVDQETGLSPDVIQMMSGGKKWVDALREWEDNKGHEGVPPGLSEPPKVSGKSDEEKKMRDYHNMSRAYLLRPETIESLFLLWKTTGDVRWRERGWEIFQAIETHSRTKYGYANVMSVDRYPYLQDNDMPSWFLAETLKYLYLLFDDSNSIPLDQWVFNTEAHPLPVFNWTTWEKQTYNISY
ncbi:hypothetical protein AX17_005897 [Amanita inopinata Kibby_2008]|nr:hypothetical protein AX17_005897 [Amanita inopinata Kibby_2008]